MNKNKRAKFDLENPIFESDSDDQINNMASQVLNLYSSEYSLVLNEAKNFFADCKQSISRFMSLNQYGLGFNLPLIWTSLIKMQMQTCGDGNSQIDQRMLEWYQSRPKYEGNFLQILAKMNQVIEDLIQIEIQIKEAYFYQKIYKPPVTDRTMKKETKISGRSSEGSRDIRRAIFNDEVSDCMAGQQENIRKQLVDRVNNSDKKIESLNNKVCREQNQLLQNIKSLQNKMASIIENVQIRQKNEARIYKHYEEKKQLKIVDSQYTDSYNPNSQDIDVATIRNLSHRLVRAHQRLGSTDKPLG